MILTVPPLTRTIVSYFVNNTLVGKFKKAVPEQLTTEHLLLILSRCHFVKIINIMFLLLDIIKLGSNLCLLFAIDLEIPFLEVPRRSCDCNIMRNRSHPPLPCMV